MAVEGATARPVLPAVAETLAAGAVGVTFGGLRPGRRGTVALQDVSLTVPRGAVVGVVGESGSGKTTLSRVLAGLQRPTTGTVQLAGTDLGRCRRGYAGGPWRSTSAWCCRTQPPR